MFLFGSTRRVLWQRWVIKKARDFIINTFNKATRHILHRTKTWNRLYHSLDSSSHLLSSLHPNSSLHGRMLTHLTRLFCPILGSRVCLARRWWSTWHLWLPDSLLLENCTLIRCGHLLHHG